MRKISKLLTVACAGLLIFAGQVFAQAASQEDETANRSWQQDQQYDQSVRQDTAREDLESSRSLAERDQDADMRGQYDFDQDRNLEEEHLTEGQDENEVITESGRNATSTTDSTR